MKKIKVKVSYTEFKAIMDHMEAFIPDALKQRNTTIRLVASSMTEFRLKMLVKAAVKTSDKITLSLTPTQAMAFIIWPEVSIMPDSEYLWNAYSRITNLIQQQTA